MQLYRAHNPKKSPLWRCAHRHFAKFVEIYPQNYQPRLGPLRPVIPQVLHKFLDCGNLDRGFARIAPAQHPAAARQTPLEKMARPHPASLAHRPADLPQCQHPMRVIAVIDQRAVVEKILRHLHLWSGTPPLAPARSPLDGADGPWTREPCDDVDPMPDYENVLTD